MPIEVRELVIRATISQDEPGSTRGSAPGTGAQGSPSEEMINTCVEKVLQIIKEKDER